MRRREGKSESEKWFADLDSWGDNSVLRLEFLGSGPMVYSLLKWKALSYLAEIWGLGDLKKEHQNNNCACFVPNIGSAQMLSEYWHIK